MVWSATLIWDCGMYEMKYSQDSRGYVEIYMQHVHEIVFPHYSSE